jgi:hypothetical protein
VTAVALPVAEGVTWEEGPPDTHTARDGAGVEVGFVFTDGRRAWARLREKNKRLGTFAGVGSAKAALVSALRTAR